MVAAGHLSPDRAYALTPRELALYAGDGTGDGGKQEPATNQFAALQQAARIDERRLLLGRLTPRQKAELARWKAKLCR